MSRAASPALTVLLVQPHADAIDLYSEFLRQQGLTCVAATSVSDALAVSARADVVVTGILLPGSADGVELIARLRADRRTARVPIIVLTACAVHAERLRAEAAGCDSFLLKPCLPSELLDEIRRVASSTRLRRVRGAPLGAAGSARARRRTNSSH